MKRKQKTQECEGELHTPDHGNEDAALAPQLLKASAELRFCRAESVTHAGQGQTFEMVFLKVSQQTPRDHQLLPMSEARSVVPGLFVPFVIAAPRIRTVLRLVVRWQAGNTALHLGGCGGRSSPSSLLGWVFQQGCQPGLEMIWGSRLASIGKGLLFAQLHIFIHKCAYCSSHFAYFIVRNGVGRRGGSNRHVSGSSAALLFRRRQAAAGARARQDVHICS